MSCKDTDCLNCKRPVCLLDLEDAKEQDRKNNPKIDRKEYQHMQYLKRKEKAKNDNVCRFCGKKCQGQMIRIDSKNYCGMDCVFCYLYEKNENRMKIIVV